MAVYEHRYSHYSGELTAQRRRWMVLARYVSRDIFRSRLVLLFFYACFLPPLVFGILIYLHYNLSALATLKLSINQLVPINGEFFGLLAVWQAVLGYLLVFLTVPPLLSRDLANNGLPLYLSRPITRAEYVVGKLAVPLLLISVITWVSELSLFVLQSILAGWEWLRPNLWISRAILATNAAWIAVVLLLAIAISAWLKSRIAAGAALMAVFIIPQIMASAVNNLFDTYWGSLISLSDLVRVVSTALFRVRGPSAYHAGDVPVLAAWLALAGFCALSLYLLARKVRAYEVAR